MVTQHKAACPGLTVLEYDEVPRGRIVYDLRTEHFIVYMDEALFTDAGPRQAARRDMREGLLSAFPLTGRRARFSTDPHYDTRHRAEPPEQEDDLEAP